VRRLWEQRLPRVAESEADALRELGGGGASGDGRGDGGREANEDERVKECGHGKSTGHGCTSAFPAKLIWASIKV